MFLVLGYHDVVSAQSLDSITVTPTDPTIDVGQNQGFTATAIFSDGSTRMLSGSPLAGGDHHSCALISDGTVQCWGWNQYGQLGNGLNTDSPVPVPVSGITNATAIAAGLAHTCALLAGGSIACWGLNEFGQLGNGLSTDSPTPVVVKSIANATAVTAGYGHTCALLGDGSVWCWGEDDLGQLGNGSGDENLGSLTPVQVVGMSNSVAIASGGWDHTCALGADGSVWCWGANDSGQLGIGRTSTLRSQATQVVGLSGATAISVGSNNSCALLADGSVQCWGADESGQIGDGGTTPIPYTTPQAVSGISNARAITTGFSHSCALLRDDAINCWGAYGADYWGQVGDGGDTGAVAPVSVYGVADGMAIEAGDDHTCVGRGDGSVWCWGLNDYGQLGDRSGINAPSPVAAIGVPSITTLRWASSSEAVAPVTQNGVALGLISGRTEISASANGIAGQTLLTVGAPGPGPTSTFLQAIPNLAAVGQPVSFLAQVSGSNPTGTVDFFEGATLLGSGTLSSGTASLATSALALGIHQVTAYYNGDAGNAASDSAAATVRITNAVDLAVTMSARPTAGSGNQPLVYAITVTNNSAFGATGVQLNHSLPSPATFNNIVTTSQGTCGLLNPSLLRCDLGALPANRQAVVNVTVTPTASTTLTSSANVFGAEADPVLANNAATVTTLIDAADLAVTLIDAPDPVGVGQMLTYTLGVSNLGPSPANNVVLGLAYDPSLTLTSFTAAGLPPTGCGGSSTQASCSISTLPNGAAGTITLNFATTAVATVSATATITSTNLDPNVANNTASTTTTVLRQRLADLAITITDTPDPVPTGGTIAYTIPVLNNGPNTDDGIAVSGSLSGGAEFVPGSLVTIGGTCNLTATTFACTGAKVVGLASANMFVNATALATGTVTLTASVTGAETDPNTPNNAATAQTLVVPPPPLTLAPIYTQGASYRIVPALPVLSPIYTQGASYRIIPPALTLAPIYTQGASYAITSNTPAGPNQTVALPGGLTATFANVSVPGNTTVVAIPPTLAGTLPGGFAVFGNLAFEVTTTATVSGPITLTFVVASAPDPLTFATLRVLHGEGGSLVDRTLLPPSAPAPDFPTRRISARVPSLSPFVIAQIMSHPPVAQCRDAVLAANGACQAIVGAAAVDAGSFDPDPGDVITKALDNYGPFGLGAHSVTLTVTDGSGASSSCGATITVRDMTPPTLVCPSNVTTEFTDALGAAVAIGPPATADNCSTTAVTSDPVSGGVFPIGSTAVTWTAADPSGNGATCRSTVVVVGALGVKGDVLADLKAVRAGLPRGAVRTGLDVAAGLLQASVDARLWMDQTHLRPATGDSAFVLERDSVATLLAVSQVVRKAGDVPVPASTLAAFIGRITRSDRLLAQVAIEDATARHGRASDIARARANLADGDVEASQDRAYRAIDDYREAWALAQKAVTGK